jgi:3D (Asp-Asp-Asp) domain-containing protein
MEFALRRPQFAGQIPLSIFILASFLIGILLILETRIQKAEAELAVFSEEPVGILEGNTLLPIADPNNPEPRVVRKIKVIITAYSSTPGQTDDTPYLTAAGTLVREGIVANNLLAFGTKIRIPELYGNKIFVVEDRMSWVKSKYQVDIWFPSYWEALNFGAQSTYIEVLES